MHQEPLLGEIDDDGPLSFNDVLDTIEHAGQNDSVTLGEILDAFAGRAFGSLLLVPAIVAILPVVGALPAVSLTTASIDLVFSIQLMLGERGFHLPERVRRLGIPRTALSRAIDMIRPVARWVGPLVHPRWQALTDREAHWAIGAVAVILSGAMLIGALVPGGIVLPATAMIILGLGLTSHDGVVVVIASALGLGSLALAYWWLIMH
jgi:hypothetical protein